MAKVNLPPDFKEFLKLLNAHQVEYLLIGGYAAACLTNPQFHDRLYFMRPRLGSIPNTDQRPLLLQCQRSSWPQSD